MLDANEPPGLLLGGRAGATAVELDEAGAIFEASRQGSGQGDQRRPARSGGLAELAVDRTTGARKRRRQSASQTAAPASASPRSTAAVTSHLPQPLARGRRPSGRWWGRSVARPTPWGAPLLPRAPVGRPGLRCGPPFVREGCDSSAVSGRKRKRRSARPHGPHQGPPRWGRRNQGTSAIDQQGPHGPHQLVNAWIGARVESPGRSAQRGAGRGAQTCPRTEVGTVGTGVDKLGTNTIIEDHQPWCPVGFKSPPDEGVTHGALPRPRRRQRG